MTAHHTARPSAPIVSLSFFSPPLPGELLYSVIARHHFLSANFKTAQTRLDLFGSAHAHISGDFPCRLAYFCERTDFDLPTLLRDHTILDIFRPFTDRARMHRAEAMMASDSATGLTNILSIQAGQLTFPAQYRYCPVCAGTDTEHYGVRYLHVAHHLPGVYACSRHRCLLLGYRRSRKLLELEPSGSPLMPVHTLPSLLRIADWCDAIFHAHAPELNLTRRISAYRYRLHERGLLTADGNIRLSQLCAALKSHWGDLLRTKPFDQFARWMDNGIFPRSLLYRPTQQYHPIKHVILLDYLFNSWPQFIDTTQRPTFSKAPTTFDTTNNPSLHKRLDAQIIATLNDNGCVLRQAASTHNVSIAFVKSVALRHGMVIDRRRQIITPKLENTIRQQLADGMSTKAIAASHAISVASVEQILTSDVDLIKKRHELRRSAALDDIHNQWLQLKLENPGANRHTLRKIAPALYARLYRLDKDWLEQHLPTATPRNRRRINTGNISPPIT